MWQRFTERARRVILIGQEQAKRLGSDHVGTEHLLLGLLVEDESVGAQALLKAGVTAEMVSQAIEAEIAEQTQLPIEPKLTSNAKRTLELAAEEARRMRHNYVGTEHLLLALLREEDGLVARVLNENGLTLDEMRQQVACYLGPGDAEPQRERRSEIVSTSKLQLGVTPELQSVLQSAARDAQVSGSEAMRIFHILQVVLQDRNGCERELLDECGLDVEKALAQIENQLKAETTDGLSTEESDDV